MSDQPAIVSATQQTVWLLCGGVPSAGNQGKTPYRSSDGGSRWSLLASTPDPAVGKIPLIGYASDLSFMSPSVGYMALARATLFRTADGGRNWTAAVGDQAVVGNSGINRIVFVDSLNGWATTGQAAVVYRTVDGGQTWHPANVP